MIKIDSVKMQGIVKRFPGVIANDCVNFDVRAGEVHALLGENGAGKSTLMKILYGLYQPNEGEICINEKPVQLRSPLDAIRFGIGMVHQHFMLIPTLTVAENVALGLRSSRRFLLDIDIVSKRIKELAKTYGLQVDPEGKVWQLSVGERQRVEILKILYRGKKYFRELVKNCVEVPSPACFALVGQGEQVHVANYPEQLLGDESKFDIR